jgi:peptidoglycan/LPS O-acetylase OafA/YrhL
MNQPTSPTPKKVLRKDIQALRALAVLSVVIFHLWPNRLPGGFVGVDVFFVISGFLITQHLLRDIARNTFSVVGFWARRIRRLLPASLTVLFVTAVSILLVAPRDLWPTWISEVGASAAYFENWALANNAVDYLAADNAASPTQHFWSLSVEEQFYFLLPILMWLLVLLFKGRKAASLSRAIVVLLSFIVLVSFVIGVYLTFAEPVSSYFFTHVRGWQFAAGALLAAVFAYVPQNRIYKIASLTIGLGLIAVSAVLLDGSMAYPGFWALLPTVGAVLALSSNLEGGPIAKLLSWRPIQFIGDISYSIYLWHWPLIILIPYALGNLTTVLKIIIIAVSFGLAALSQKFIEQPFINRGRREGSKHRTAIALMFAACGGMLISSIAISAQADVSIRTELTQQQEVVKSGLDCLGAASNAPDGVACINPDLDEILLPSLDLASHDSPSLLLPASCQGTKASDSVPKPCNLTGETADVKIALIGDSHSAQFMAPMLELAKQNNWQVISYSKGGCPLSYAERTHDAVLSKACKKWVMAAVKQLKTTGFDLVVTSQVSGTEWASGKVKQSTYARDGLVKIWKELNSAGVPVLVIKDNPRPIKASLLCIKKNKYQNFDACQNTKKAAMLADPQPAAVKLLNSPITQLIDFTDVYCDELNCEAVIGGVIVNRDENHLTNTFSRTLAPYIEVEILKLLGVSK